MPDNKTVWTCKVTDDKPAVRLEDIPARQLVEVERQTDTSWLYLVGAPIQDVGRALAMYDRCCALVGVEPAEQSAGELLARFDLVEDDRPTMYEGGLPDPKADELTTVPLSGS